MRVVLKARGAEPAFLPKVIEETGSLFMKRILRLTRSTTSGKVGEYDAEHLLNRPSNLFGDHLAPDIGLLLRSLRNPPCHKRVDMSRQLLHRRRTLTAGELSKPDEDRHATADGRAMRSSVPSSRRHSARHTRQSMKTESGQSSRASRKNDPT